MAGICYASLLQAQKATTVTLPTHASVSPATILRNPSKTAQFLSPKQTRCSSWLGNWLLLLF
jgi:hypothetical protein